MRPFPVVGAVLIAHLPPCLGVPGSGGTGDTAEAPGPQPVVGVPTAVAAFVGATEVASDPVLVSSMAEVNLALGGPATDERFTLHSALGLYFQNGGAQALVVSAGTYDAPPDRGAYEAGLDQLRIESTPTLVALPDAASLLAPAELFALHATALRHCAELRDRFCLLDLPSPESLDSAVDGFRAAVPGTDGAWGAAYTPWLELPSGALVPPSGAIAGIYARVDRSYGVWKAPANEAVTGIAGLAHDIDDLQQQSLNEDVATGLSINAIRSFAGAGTLVWGSRTLAGNDNEWRYVPVRRTAIYLEQSLRSSTDWVVFEPNVEPLWTELRTRVDTFFRGLWQQGALQGATPEEAYFVRVGLGDTMTEADLDAGRVRLVYGFAPLRPAEFIVAELTWER